MVHARQLVINRLGNMLFDLDSALDALGFAGMGTFEGSDEVREELMRIGRELAGLKMRLVDGVSQSVSLSGRQPGLYVTG